MAPGSDADVGIEAVLGTELDELMEVSVAGPVELAFDFFVVDPDDVGGDDGDSAGFHFEDFVFPLGMGEADVVEFAHDWDPGFVVLGEVLAVGGDFDSLRIVAA